MNFDDTLQEKLSLVTTDEGYTEENGKEVYQYIVDNAYDMGIFCTESYRAIPLIRRKYENIRRN